TTNLRSNWVQHLLLITKPSQRVAPPSVVFGIGHAQPSQPRAYGPGAPPRASVCAIYLRLPGQEHPLAMELLQTMLCLASLQAFDDLRENVLLEITSKFHDFVIAQLGFFFDDHCEHVESVARRARAERNLLRGAVGL